MATGKQDPAGVPARAVAKAAPQPLHQSGLLDEQPDGIAAPRLLGCTEYPDDEPWMWFEDVDAQASIGWPVERFELAARHFGRLHGIFTDSPPLAACQQLDRSDWFGKEVARTCGQIPAVLEGFRTHPLTSGLWDRDLGERIRQFWESRDVVVEAPGRMPRTLCHGVLCIPNPMSRRRDDGTDETVLIDWQYAGRSQIGHDMAGLISDSSLLAVRRKVAEADEFTGMMLDAYLSGLQDSGQERRIPVARFACLATLAYHWGLYVLLELNDRVLQRKPDREDRAQLVDALDHCVRAQRFVLRVAEEARGMLPEVLPALCEADGH